MQFFCKKEKNILIPVLETEKDVYQITYNRFHTKEIFSMNRFDKKKEEFVEVSSKSPLYKQGLLLARKMTPDEKMKAICISFIKKLHETSDFCVFVGKHIANQDGMNTKAVIKYLKDYCGFISLEECKQSINKYLFHEK